MPRPIKDLTAKVFTRLTALYLCKKKKNNSYYWYCQCSCGNFKEVSSGNLTSAQVKSCGCLKKDTNTKHGQHTSGAYNSWALMKQRCSNPNNKDYEHYGAKGIYYSKNWENFTQFFKDMGDRPKDLTLERIDNALGYSKTNCKWATRKEQAQNRHPTRFLTFNEKTLCVLQWAEELEISKGAIEWQLSKGLSIEKIILAHK